MEKQDMRYCVRFVRRDHQPDEEYFYWKKADAENHFRMFKYDDSGLYRKIVMEVEASNRVSTVAQYRFSSKMR